MQAALPALGPPPPPLPPLPCPPLFWPDTVALVQLAPASRTTAPAKTRALWLLRTQVPIRAKIVLVDIGRASSGGGCKNLVSLPTRGEYNNCTTGPEKRNFWRFRPAGIAQDYKNARLWFLHVSLTLRIASLFLRPLASGCASHR